MPNRLLDKRWPWFAAAAAIVLLFLAAIIEVPGDPGDKRPRGTADDISALAERSDVNVLFIVIDTLRADRLGTYGYARDTSPTLDRIAADGVRFARHLSQSSWTKSSMASLWTGMYPARTGINRFDDVIPDVARMPAEILKEAGFRTVGVYRNGWVAPTFGFHQGFDIYMRPAPSAVQRNVQVENPTLKLHGSDEDAITAAIEFLRVSGGERWFLYLHLMDLHEYTYDAESALFGGSYSDIYDNSIRWTDGSLAVLWEYLTAWGYRENTLIAITSDHGEGFRERPGIEGHARTLFRETTEVPFLLSFPFHLDPGIVVAARSRGIDVWPTLLDLLGLAPADGIDGRSLVPEILAAARHEPGPAGDGTAVSHLEQNWGQPGRALATTVSIVDGELRYVRTPEFGRDVEYLYDAAEDPMELRDRSEEDPEGVARLRDVANEYLTQQPPWGKAPTREVGELELNQLRALGYEFD